jgi:MoaA/NifB/PqqE/SkfB family radical SAM enzyme
MEKNAVLREIKIPESYNYIAVFLTFACNLGCSYCINRFEQKVVKRKMISGKEWVKGLNRIVSRPDLPVSLQGGEPSLHEDFIYIVNHLKPELNIDILTNLQFDIDRFMAEVDPDRVKRNSPYASLRVSYHPEQMDLDLTIKKVLKMLHKGFSVGIWGVMNPKYEENILQAQSRCRESGIDFRTKEFLGELDGKMHGNYKYAGACDKKFRKKAECRTTEFLIDSQAHIFRCHADLYAGTDPVGNLLDPDFKIDDSFKECVNFGHCNPCDIKVKTNRFQQFGHTSVEIRCIE